MGVLVTVFAILGVAVSGYVWYKQVTTGPVLCVGDGCAKVIRSPYGRLLGIPNGALGVAYFGAATVAPFVAPTYPAAWLLLKAATAIALALYGYLTYLQSRLLHAWCIWCLSSAALTLAVFLAIVRGP